MNLDNIAKLMYDDLQKRKSARVKPKQTSTKDKTLNS